MSIFEHLRKNVWFQIDVFDKCKTSSVLPNPTVSPIGQYFYSLKFHLSREQS